MSGYLNVAAPQTRDGLKERGDKCPAAPCSQGHSTIRKLVQFEHKRPYLLQVVDLELSRVGWDDGHALGFA